MIEIVAFKHSENKLYHLFSLRFNKDNDGKDPAKKYLDLPCKVSISLECHFMSVTTYGGEVRLFKFVPIVDPFKGIPLNEQVPNKVPSDGRTTPESSRHELVLVNKTELETIAHQLVELDTLHLRTFPAKTTQKFSDPFEKPRESVVGEEQKDNLAPEEKAFTYEIGKSLLDADGGDVSRIPKKSTIFPSVYFLRSQFVSKDPT